MRRPWRTLGREAAILTFPGPLSMSGSRWWMPWPCGTEAWAWASWQSSSCLGRWRQTRQRRGSVAGLRPRAHRCYGPPPCQEPCAPAPYPCGPPSLRCWLDAAGRDGGPAVLQALCLCLVGPVEANQRNGFDSQQYPSQLRDLTYLSPFFCSVRWRSNSICLLGSWVRNEMLNVKHFSGCLVGRPSGLELLLFL